MLLLTLIPCSPCTDLVALLIAGLVSASSQLTRSRCIIPDSIGLGSFGHVYQATSRITGAVRAVKCVRYAHVIKRLAIPASAAPDPDARTALADDPVGREASILRGLRHVRVIGMLDHRTQQLNSATKLEQHHRILWRKS